MDGMDFCAMIEVEVSSLILPKASQFTIQLFVHGCEYNVFGKMKKCLGRGVILRGLISYFYEQLGVKPTFSIHAHKKRAPIITAPLRLADSD